MDTKNKNRVVVVHQKTSPALIVALTIAVLVLVVLAVVLALRVFDRNGSAAANSPEAIAATVNAVADQMGSTNHPSGAVYIGQQACVSCHKEQATKMSQVRMSAAIERLTGSLDVPDAIRNPRCLGCHVTGFGLARAQGVSAADMVNVQCEACHGPGSKYVELMRKGYKASDPALSKEAAKLGLTAKPNKQTCFNCHHDEPGQTPWNYQEHREFIRHWDGA